MRYEWDERKNRENRRSMLASHSNWQCWPSRTKVASLNWTALTKQASSDGICWAGSQSSREAGTSLRLFMSIGRTKMAKKSSASSPPAGLVRMSTEDIRNGQWTEAEKRAVREAAKARAEGRDLPEEEYEDIPRLTKEQLDRMVRLRDVRRKVAVSVRLDPQVLEWLRSKGEGHLTRINDILTNLMEAERNTGTRR